MSKIRRYGGCRQSQIASTRSSGGQSSLGFAGRSHRLSQTGIHGISDTTTRVTARFRSIFRTRTPRFLRRHGIRHSHATGKLLRINGKGQTQSRKHLGGIVHILEVTRLHFGLRSEHRLNGSFANVGSFGGVFIIDPTFQSSSSLTGPSGQRILRRFRLAVRVCEDHTQTVFLRFLAHHQGLSFQMFQFFVLIPNRATMIGEFL
mmetsp:Transcript_8231/g.17163  ORF Transcript_8231/g.17163 Transcript_8231/m.17163 type:complete len:204 (+) Transcript_8231:433-1044(+)